MTKTAYRAGLGAILALGLLAAPAAFAEEGKTSTGAESNSANQGNKADKSTQENAASADKEKQAGSEKK